MTTATSARIRPVLIFRMVNTSFRHKSSASAMTLPMSSPENSDQLCCEHYDEIVRGGVRYEMSGFEQK